MPPAPLLDSGRRWRPGVAPPELWGEGLTATTPAASDRSQGSRLELTSRSDPRWAPWAAPVGVCLFTALLAQVPPLLGSRSFYTAGDSDAQFLPTWFRLGQLVRAGQWPPLLDPASWQGGNYPSEALFGVYNPINLVTWLIVSASSNLEVAAILVKTEFLTLLALGVYLLSREYGAARWAASIVAVAAPFAGFTLYWDAASWASGLVAFAHVPYAWWALRRVARGSLSPLPGFAVGALTVTQGNPYGVLGLAVAGVGLLVECAAARDGAAVRRLVLLSLCVAAVLPLVFWPLLATAPLAHRSDLASISNTDFMSVNPGDLFGLSSPTLLPGIDTFVEPMNVPAVYHSWLLLPLLPWLRWSQLRVRMRTLLSLPGVAALYVLFTTGPSAVWLFRWPLRLTEYLYLPVGVALAVALSLGLAVDRIKARTSVSLSLVGLGFFLAWAQRPELVGWHLAALAVVAGLTLAVVAAVRAFASRGPLPLVCVATGGTLLVLTLQVLAFPSNPSSGNWNLPHDVAHLQDRFGSRYAGTTIQYANLGPLREASATEGPSVWRDYLGGSMYHVAGVDAVNTYSGVGLEAFTDRLCMDYSANTCESGYRNLWKPVRPRQPPLAELLKLSTVVVDRSLVAPITVPVGWHAAKRSQQTLVLQRDSAYLWPSSRLSWVSPGTTVAAATSTPRQEVLTVRPTSRGRSTLVFARLGWPGYSARFGGQSVPVSRNPVGLLEVRLPAGAPAGSLVVTFRPPGFAVGLALTGLGFLGAAALAVWPRLRRPG